jgi:hypothetical protein
MTTDQLKALILAQPADGPLRIAYAAGNDNEVARLLRVTLAPQSALPPLTSAAQLMGLLSAESFATVFDHPRFSDFKATFDSGSRTGVLQWVEAFAGRGLITVGETSAIVAYLTTPTTQDLPLVADCTAADVSLTRSVE